MAERFVKEAREQYAEAERTFEQVLRLGPDDAATQLGMGNVLYAQGELDEAYSACSRAIRLMPSFTSTHHDLAMICEAPMKREPVLPMIGAVELWLPGGAPTSSCREIRRTQLTMQPTLSCLD